MNANRLTLNNILENLQNNKENYISQSEEFFKSQTNKVLNTLVQDKNIKFILLAGPSSSGKTTTSKLLTENLIKNGFDALAISLDDYFVERELTPKWKDGTYNYETYMSIDWKLFGKTMQSLLKGNVTILPVYNFKTGYKEFGIEGKKLKEDTIVVVEGLHALNPIIDKYIPTEKSLKVYTSVNTDVYKNTKLIISHSTVRFYRRLIRDLFTRNISIEETINYWQKVNLGEELYIKPYIDTAKIKIDSFHPYELSVYNNVLNTFKHFNSKQLDEAKKVLEIFGEINYKTVPKDSVLQEFIPSK